MNIGDLRDTDNTGTVKAITVHGKGNKQRVLTAEPALVDVLTAYLQSRLTRFPGSGKTRSSPTDSPWRRLRAYDPLFVGTDGERITGPTIQYRVERAYRRAGIHGQRAKGALVHQLRHTFATSLADADVNVYALMRLLGQSPCGVGRNRPPYACCWPESAQVPARWWPATSPTPSPVSSRRHRSRSPGGPGRTHHDLPVHTQQTPMPAPPRRHLPAGCAD